MNSISLQPTILTYFPENFFKEKCIPLIGRIAKDISTVLETQVAKKIPYLIAAILSINPFARGCFGVLLEGSRFFSNLSGFAQSHSGNIAQWSGFGKTLLSVICITSLFISLRVTVIASSFLNLIESTADLATHIKEKNYKDMIIDVCYIAAAALVAIASIFGPCEIVAIGLLIKGAVSLFYASEALIDDQYFEFLTRFIIGTTNLNLSSVKTGKAAKVAKRSNPKMRIQAKTTLVKEKTTTPVVAKKKMLSNVEMGELLEKGLSAIGVDQENIDFLNKR